MDTFELNKIAGWTLGAVLFVLGVGFVAELIFDHPPLETAGYAIEVPEEGETATAPEEEATPLPVLLASASAESGESVVKKCAACHSFEQGGPNKVGPNLYGVPGRVMGSVAGFSYSDALAARNAAGDVWTYEALNQFLADPKGYIEGTSMAFAGLNKPEDRADAILYLRQQSDNPPDLPEVAEAPAADEAAGAETADGDVAEDESASTVETEVIEADPPVTDVPAEGATDATQPAPPPAAAEEPAASAPAAEEPADEPAARDGAAPLEAEKAQ